MITAMAEQVPVVPPAARQTLQRRVRLREVSQRAGRRDRPAAGRPVDAGHLSHRRRQEPLLPTAGPAARRPDGRRLAAHRPDEGPDRFPGRARRAGRPARFQPRSRRDLARLRRAPRRTDASCSTSRRSGSATSGSCSSWRGSRSACWPSTRPIASASGATTSGPTI